MTRELICWSKLFIRRGTQLKDNFDGKKNVESVDSIHFFKDYKSYLHRHPNILRWRTYRRNLNCDKTHVKR